jgi:anti-sigma regulatory factor (Ser/Thr protein kinase)
VTSAAGPPARRDFPASETAIDDFASWMRERLLATGFEGERAVLAEVALVEAFTNIVQHAITGRRDATASVEAGPTDDGIEVTFEDLGPAFDPTTAPRKERRGDEAHGMGLGLIEEITTTRAYEWRDGKNRLTLVFAR